MRIAFAGSSGTGKTTLATWLAEVASLPINPVGSRSVAKEMGLVNAKGEPDPYLADERGVRGEFQDRLLTEKVAWEQSQPAFVTDRTTLDNATYTILHNAANIRAAYLKSAVEAMSRYDVVFYCPTDSFVHIGDDAARVGARDGRSAEDARAYQDVYNALLFALLLKHWPSMVVLAVDGIEDRKRIIAKRLRIEI